MVYLPQHGFTLTESMIAVCIAAILSVTAMPSYLSWRQQSEFIGALRQSHALLHHGRAHALSHRKTVNVAVDPSDGGCIGLTTESSCNCHLIGNCQLSGQEYRLSYDVLHTSLALSGNKKKTITFDGTHGMGFSTALTLSIANARHHGRVIVSNLGRSRICATAQAINTHGIPKC